MNECLAHCICKAFNRVINKVMVESDYKPRVDNYTNSMNGLNSYGPLGLVCRGLGLYNREPKQGRLVPVYIENAYDICI